MNSEKLYVGNIVKTINTACYDKMVPIGTVGEIIKIRKRYVRTINEYYQYLVKFDEYPELLRNQLNNLYTRN